MGKVLHTTSTLTDRYQTTIPEQVRRALHLGKRDRIDYAIDDSGKVVLSRADEDDPILTDFLNFLANDIKAHPEHIKPINSALFNRANSLIADMKVDLDAPLNEEDE